MSVAAKLTIEDDPNAGLPTAANTTARLRAALESSSIPKHALARYQVGTSMKSIASAAGAAAFLMLLCAPARAQDPSGIWFTEEKDAKIQITKCGNAYCGTIVWLARPLDPDTGKPTLDKQNPDASKRRRQIMGITILTGMQPNGTNKWSGPIYNADDGNSYDGHISVASPTVLKVEGCLFNVCQAQNWTRTTN